MYVSNMSDRSAISVFTLFGEQEDLPDVIHCETVQVRSRLHDFTFAPHRHGRLHQVLMLERGQGRASLDGRDHDLAPMGLVNVPANCVHAYEFTRDSDGYVVTLAAELLDDSLKPEEGLAQVLARPAVLAGASAHLATLRAIFDEFDGRGFGRAHALRSLAGVLLARIARDLSEGEAGEARRAVPELLRRFEVLLDRHFLDHWTVSDYADALAVTPTHLSRLARQATGRPASGLIEERMIREARRFLVYTDLPVSAIGFALGFEDPAYFSRVFTRATGHAPRAFRQKVLA